MESLSLEDRAIKGFIGFGCSFGGKWFGGYARDNRNGGVNFADRAKRGILKKVESFRDNGNQPECLCTSYSHHHLPRESGPAVIYCDPPYRGATGYSCSQGFDTAAFNYWVRAMVSRGHRIVISEYAHNAPGGAKILWSQGSRKSIRDASGKPIQTTEILYTF
jgi:DNA adenine methylase